MKYLSKEEISNKKVLLRCDFNVTVKNNKIIDTSKIDKSLDTINYLLKNKNKVILLSHFGRVKNEEDKEKNSLYVVYKYLKNFFDIEFIKDPLNLDKINESDKEIFLVENTRFTDVPEKRESANDLELAGYWSKYADVFVIDAFASLHRAHSSTAGLATFLPTYIGFLVEKELTNLDELIHIDEHPFTVIMGGAKVDDKIKIIEGLLKKCDELIITGGILNTFLKVMGYNVGNSLVSKDEEVITSVTNILNNYKDKIKYSKKFKVERNNEVVEVNLDEIKKNDIIYDNIIDFDFDNSKLIFFNGTCGKYEEDDYEEGTKVLLEKLASTKGLVYIGGGDTVSAVNKLGFTNSYKYLSSGGGATLEYVAYNKLKGLEFIKENSVDF